MRADLGLTFVVVALVALTGAANLAGAGTSSAPARATGACAGYQTLYTGTLPDQTLPAGGNNTINYPIGLLARPGESVDLAIDFGDGATDTLHADDATSDNASHTYTTAGAYTVTVKGTGVAMVPGPCRYPYDYAWTVTVQQSLGQPTAPSSDQPRLDVATPVLSTEVDPPPAPGPAGPSAVDNPIAPTW